MSAAEPSDFEVRRAALDVAGGLIIPVDSDYGATAEEYEEAIAAACRAAVLAAAAASTLEGYLRGDHARLRYAAAAEAPEVLRGAQLETSEH